MNEKRCDLVVVGGGLAGLTAAVRSAELGLSVVVLEAGDASRYLCNGRLAMGFFNVTFRDIREGKAVLRQAIDAATMGAAAPELVDALSGNVGSALQWLRARGVRTIAGNWRPGMAAMVTPPAAIGAGLHWHGRGADQMLRRLETLLVHLAGRLARGTRARELKMCGGSCVGVIAESQGARPISWPMLY